VKRGRKATGLQEIAGLPGKGQSGFIFKMPTLSQEVDKERDLICMVKSEGMRYLPKINILAKIREKDHEEKNTFSHFGDGGFIPI
jgi:hypothetical protein